MIGNQHTTMNGPKCMTNPSDSSDPRDDLSKRSRSRRKNVIGNSPHADEYTRLLQAGWSSLALERYAKFRYAEDIPAKTFRDYRQRKQIQAKLQTEATIDPDALIDIVAERAELIRIQKARIAVDVELEAEMNKLFSTTGKEIERLSELLDQYKGDLQDLGAFPKLGEIVRLGVPAAPPRDPEVDGDRVAPRARNLGELLATTPDKAAQLARMLHDALPMSNGHQVIEGSVNDE